MYQHGKGTEQNDRKAVYWYRKAAKQGNADAQCDLGWMYDYGHSVKKILTKQLIYILEPLRMEAR
ncbi:sel1 repeat family protein [Aeromonas veronii]